MATDESTSTPDSRSAPAASGRPIWAVVVIVAMLLAFTAFVLVLRTAKDATRTVEQLGERAVDLASSFRTGTITTSFVAALPELTSAGSGRLELATSKITETFRRNDERRILWERVWLGETAVEIRVPVTYRYHVRLDDPWRLEVSGQTCVVHAPRIRPSLPPAIHTDGMEKRTSSSGWFAADPEEEMQTLERTLTPLLSTYAGDPRHLGAVREASRRTIANFVRDWLLREDHWRDDRFHSIVVFFPGEAEDALPAPSLTIRE